MEKEEEENNTESKEKPTNVDDFLNPEK